MKIAIDIPEDVYTRLFDTGIQDNEIAIDDVREMARALRLGTPLPDLESGKAVAFDFDGVIHKYSEGWKDGSIYDEPNMEILNLILLLQLANIPCVIISTREPNQIKEWWDKQGFTIMAKPLCFETRFFNDCTYVGITNRKIPAQLYIDDRAYRYTGQTAKEFLIDCSKKKKKNETGQAESDKECEE